MDSYTGENAALFLPVLFLGFFSHLLSYLGTRDPDISYGITQQQLTPVLLLVRLVVSFWLVP